MELVRENEIRGRVGAVFDHQRDRLAGLLPQARIEHVGSTAVPGSLTKGDLDICLSVRAEEFPSAAAVLSAAFTVHQPENWTDGLASFVAPAEDEVEIGIQLVVTGGPEEEWFIGWRERLRADAELRERYDRCKAEHRDAPVEAYRAAKERLILG
ncbi:MAG TPA: GrpB family protein [Solirubrobacterales bacterium]|nr:GrpB family protein [Solirubrobacterales bacterium]